MGLHFFIVMPGVFSISARAGSAFFGVADKNDMVDQVEAPRSFGSSGCAFARAARPDRPGSRNTPDPLPEVTCNMQPLPSNSPATHDIEEPVTRFRPTTPPFDPETIAPLEAMAASAQSRMTSETLPEMRRLTSGAGSGVGQTDIDLTLGSAAVLEEIAAAVPGRDEPLPMVVIRPPAAATCPRNTTHTAAAWSSAIDSLGWKDWHTTSPNPES